jgi:hypothetical protein
VPRIISDADPAGNWILPVPRLAAANVLGVDFSRDPGGLFFGFLRGSRMARDHAIKRSCSVSESDTRNFHEIELASA